MEDAIKRIQIINRDGYLWKGLLIFQKFIMAFSSILVVGLISYGAAIRYIFEKDFYGMEELVLFIGFWMYFMGGSYGSFSRTHISAEVIPNYIKNKRTQGIVRLIASTCTTLLCFLLTYWGLLLVLWNIQTWPVTPALKIPIVASQGAIALGLVLMSFYTLIYTIEDFRCFKLTGELCVREEAEITAQKGE